jgi:sulfate adenylyltransferase subunit 2
LKLVYPCAKESGMDLNNFTMSHLQTLESESIHILREVAAEFERPVFLYSVGKDSSVLLRLIQKAFYPGKIPFPLLHVDTSYKFKEMYEFRDQAVKRAGAELIVYRNEEAVSRRTHPSAVGTQACCAQLKTGALLNALSKYDFQAAIGGARRDEEKSRAKERIYSHRDEHGQWDPKNQRPELWNLYNPRIKAKETIRVFPLSNWTELDIWLYIFKEKIDVVPLYFAKSRKVIASGSQLIPVEDEKRAGASSVMCRFRSLGCVPCSGAVRSAAVSVEDIILELLSAKTSERATRVIDHDADSSMETKKREGYF